MARSINVDEVLNASLQYQNILTQKRLEEERKRQLQLEEERRQAAIRDQKRKEKQYKDQNRQAAIGTLIGAAAGGAIGATTGVGVPIGIGLGSSIGSMLGGAQSGKAPSDTEIANLAVQAGSAGYQYYQNQKALDFNRSLYSTAKEMDPNIFSSSKLSEDELIDLNPEQLQTIISTGMKANEYSKNAMATRGYSKILEDKLVESHASELNDEQRGIIRKSISDKLDPFRESSIPMLNAVYEQLYQDPSVNKNALTWSINSGKPISEAPKTLLSSKVPVELVQDLGVKTFINSNPQYMNFSSPEFKSLPLTQRSELAKQYSAELSAHPSPLVRNIGKEWNDLNGKLEKQIEDINKQTPDQLLKEVANNPVLQKSLSEGSMAVRYDENGKLGFKPFNLGESLSIDELRYTDLVTRFSKDEIASDEVKKSLDLSRLANEKANMGYVSFLPKGVTPENATPKQLARANADFIANKAYVTSKNSTAGAIDALNSPIATTPLAVGGLPDWAKTEKIANKKEATLNDISAAYLSAGDKQALLPNEIQYASGQGIDVSKIKTRGDLKKYYQDLNKDRSPQSDIQQVQIAEEQLRQLKILTRDPRTADLMGTVGQLHMYANTPNTESLLSIGAKGLLKATGVANRDVVIELTPQELASLPKVITDGGYRVGKNGQPLVTKDGRVPFKLNQETLRAMGDIFNFGYLNATSGKSYTAGELKAKQAVSPLIMHSRDQYLANLKAMENDLQIKRNALTNLLSSGDPNTRNINASSIPQVQGVGFGVGGTPQQFNLQGQQTPSQVSPNTQNFFGQQIQKLNKNQK